MAVVRLAEPNDAKAVAEHLATLHIDDQSLYTEQSVAEPIKAKSVYVAFDPTTPGDEALLGAMILVAEQQSYIIDAIACRIDAQRRGAGRALVEYAAQKCRDEGVPKLWCWSLAMYHAEEFYRKLGFGEAFLLEKQFYGKDCWLLGKVIDRC
jgi:N-acetylglutamate synthase-like GNAT family acetyltransferase